MRKGIEIYAYQYIGPVAAGHEILNAITSCRRGQKRGEVLIELGTRRARYTCIGDSICFIVDNKEYCIQLSMKIKESAVYRLMPDSPYQVALWDQNYVKLKSIGQGKPPTVEIDGIHMHRIEDIDPYTDALLKVKALRICRKCKVLDTCMGLGYTAIAAARRAQLVVTVEVDDKILWVAQHNPWSRGLTSKNIYIVRGDIIEVITWFKDEVFDRIIHDPPRFSLAPELYSSEFYAELFRVLKRGGILYHYTGMPGKRRGINIVKSVADKLRGKGFVGIHFRDKLQGIIAYKPWRI